MMCVARQITNYLCCFIFFPRSLFFFFFTPSDLDSNTNFGGGRGRVPSNIFLGGTSKRREQKIIYIGGLFVRKSQIKRNKKLIMVTLSFFDHVPRVSAFLSIYYYFFTPEHLWPSVLKFLCMDRF